jgi:hypothetical protein
MLPSSSKQPRRARLLNRSGVKVTLVVEFKENTETYENLGDGKYQRIESFVDGVDSTQEDDYLVKITVYKGHSETHVLAEKQLDTELRGKSLSLIFQACLASPTGYEVAIVEYLPDQERQVQMTLKAM